jgi:dephospho-CoA kinase
MILFGVTGGIAMGKSTAAELLRELGAAVTDADALARAVVAPGEPALTEVRRVFGAEMVGEHGELRRERMAELVFGDPAARRRLEAILHPRIRALWQAEVAGWRAAGRAAAAVVIPLLFEMGAEAEFDATICVACTAAAQQERLAARGWTPEQSAQRLQAQWAIERKMAMADYVVWSEGGPEVLREQLRRIVEHCAGNRVSLRRKCVNARNLLDTANPP